VKLQERVESSNHIAKNKVTLHFGGLYPGKLSQLREGLSKNKKGKRTSGVTRKKRDVKGNLKKERNFSSPKGSLKHRGRSRGGRKPQTAEKARGTKKGMQKSSRGTRSRRKTSPKVAKT